LSSIKDIFASNIFVTLHKFLSKRIELLRRIEYHRYNFRKNVYRSKERNHAAFKGAYTERWNRKTG